MNLVVIVKCCREWPVFLIFQGAAVGWGKCGICGEVPR